MVTRGSFRLFAFHVGAALLCVLLLRFCYRNLFDDPTSYFFDPLSDDGLRVSQTRIAEVDRYFQAVHFDQRSDQDRDQPQKPILRRWPKRLCLGIVNDPTRPGHDELSLARTLASLRSDLTTNDRNSMHMIALLAAESRSDHFAFGKPWLPRLVDEVLVYGKSSEDNTTLPGLHAYTEVDGDVPKAHREAPNERYGLDHSTILEACRRTQAVYVAVVESGFVATSDWHPRLVSAVTQANKAARTTGGDWAYIKLFYHPTPQWSPPKDSWPTRALEWTSMYIVAVLGGVGLIKWGFYRRKITMKDIWQESMPLLTLVVWVPVFVGLIYLAGGAHTLQLHFWPYVGGIRELSREACCEHGMAFQQRYLEEVAVVLGVLPSDLGIANVLDHLAVERGLSRWVMDPAIAL
ncbi:hypothetical protein QBC34DRAFT_225077 [Podospora aff. communis PSN243]|uniref:Transmembrane protein n=1 Tax=Podospora aff. communis PSN243 TaxID=3040156 RepID=A0AAV9FZ67_9PEZI|nr:hypothetical protein QBC34DRAFT_225077 [Podospora aff. communis PSN243]